MVTNVLLECIMHVAHCVVPFSLHVSFACLNLREFGVLCEFRIPNLYMLGADESVPQFLGPR